MGRPGIYILYQFIILILWHGRATSVQDEAVLLPTVPQLHNGITPNLTSSRKFLAPVLLYVNHNCCFQPVVNTIALANDIELNPGPLSSTHNSSQYSGLSELDTSINESSLSSQHIQNGMPCLFVNARSIKNKLLDFQTYVYNYNFKIIGVAETWLADYITSSCIFRNYRNTHGGGVLLAISPELQPIHILPTINLQETDSQSIWASVVIGSKRWLCGVFYRPRREDMVSLDCLEETLHCLHAERYAGTLLMGDFNADQLQSNAHSKFVIRLSEITDSLGLHQLVRDITRNNPDSILDLVYTTHPDQITDAAVAEKLTTSDHYMVTFVNPPRRVYQYYSMISKQTGTVLSLKMMSKVLEMPSLKHFLLHRCSDT